MEIKARYADIPGARVACAMVDVHEVSRDLKAAQTQSVDRGCFDATASMQCIPVSDLVSICEAHGFLGK
jgi:hypothetical protein